MPVEQVPVGATVLVRPAERIPVDGRITSGRSAVNQAPITGESAPVDKAPGGEVFAGTINGEGALEIETTRAAGDRTLDRVIRLVAEAQAQKARTEQLTSRFERIFVPVVLVSDVLLITVPPLLGVWDWSVSFYRGMALLVAASPCALALGTPAAVLAGIAQAARHGVLVKGGIHLENLGLIKALAVDKTGTLTTGVRRSPTSSRSRRPRTNCCASRPRSSASRSIRWPRPSSGTPPMPVCELPDASALESVTARGVRSQVDGQVVEIGGLRMWRDAPGGIPLEVRTAVETLQAAARSTVVVRSGGRWLGAFGIADLPRANVRAALDALRALGVRPIVMLTGDNEHVASAVGREVGIDDVRADLLPEQKVQAMEALRRAHGEVGMIGDGVNDGPALAKATVGIAMGAAGTAVALEAADVALMGDDIGQLAYAVALARRTRRVIRQNLAIALGVIVVLIGATTSGVAGIGPAVVFHEGSTIVVIVNALRLLRFRVPAPVPRQAARESLVEAA